MPRNTASIRVGRLLEIRANAGYRTRSDVDAIFEAIGRELSKLPPNQPHVTVVDWRHCPLMAPEAAEHMLKKIASVNAQTLRSAALASDDSTLAVLQFVRLIRNANLPDRKLFLHSDSLYDWLAEVLTWDERVRLMAFLSEGETAPRASASLRPAG